MAQLCSQIVKSNVSARQIRLTCEVVTTVSQYLRNPRMDRSTFEKCPSAYIKSVA